MEGEEAVVVRVTGLDLEEVLGLVRVTGPVMAPDMEVAWGWVIVIDCITIIDLHNIYMYN